MMADPRTEVPVNWQVPPKNNDLAEDTRKALAELQLALALNQQYRADRKKRT